MYARRYSHRRSFIPRKRVGYGTARGIVRAIERALDKYKRQPMRAASRARYGGSRRHKGYNPWWGAGRPAPLTRRKGNYYRPKWRW